MDALPQGRSEALRRVAEALNETLDAEAAIAALLPELEGVLGLRTAWAFRYRPERGDFVKIAATGLPPALAADDQRPLGEQGCECQRRFRAGQLDRAVNMVTCSRLRDATGDKAGLVLHASVPLRRGEHALGILNVAAPGAAHFDQESLALLSAVGNQFAVALGRAESQAAAERRARQLASLAEAATALAAAGDAQAILRLCVELGTESLGLPRLAVVDEREAEVLAFSAPTLASDVVPVAGQSTHLFMDSRATLRQPISADESLCAETAEAAFDPGDRALFEAYAALLRSALTAARRQTALREAAVVAERQRIAADLHDAVSQRLFAAILGVRTARLASEEQPAESRRQLETAEEQIRVAQSELRTLVHTLLWQAPADLGAALRDLARAFSVGVGPVVSARIGTVPPGLSPEAAHAILRVAQEALHNAVRHAEARHVRVSLGSERGDLVLRVRDDGRGFPQGAPRGAGLRSMRQRADAVGARLVVRPDRPAGVRVELRLPLAGGGGA